jgi:hypothetical protein
MFHILVQGGLTFLVMCDEVSKCDLTTWERRSCIPTSTVRLPAHSSRGVIQQLQSVAVDTHLLSMIITTQWWYLMSAMLAAMLRRQPVAACPLHSLTRSRHASLPSLGLQQHR